MALSSLLSADTLLDLLPEPMRSILPRTRRVRSCPGGVRIELRNIGGPRTERPARLLEERLLAAGAPRAEVNGALGCVFVACDAASDDLGKLVAIVEELDQAGDEYEGGGGEGGERPFPSVRDGADQQARAALSLGLHLAGAGLALAGRLARVPRLSAAVPSFLSLAEHTPRVRRELERRIGKPGTDSLLAVTRIVTYTLAMRPATLLIDSVAATGRFVAARAGSRAWELREEEFAAVEGAYRHTRAAAGPRPVPLPRGPVERYADAAAAASLAGHGLTTAISRDHQRGLSVLIAGVPKAATLGRDAFTSAVTRCLARRGTIVLDHDALCRMDRIDTVVLDAAVLTTGAWTIDGVDVLAPDVDPDDLHARLYTLLDLTDPSARREHDGWTATPEAPGTTPDTGLPEGRGIAPDRPQEGVRFVEVARDGRAVARVRLARELHPLAEALVAAPRKTCEVILAGGDEGLAERLGVDRAVEGGSRLAATVRAMQADGHGVAVVSRRARRALRQADLGVGVLDGARRVPWDAAVLGEIESAYVLLRCLPPARKASLRGVWVAAAGSVAGAGLALLGPGATAVSRANVARDCTSLAALAVGEWVGRAAGRTPAPVRADHTPWHAMAARDVLARLRTSPEGLTEAEAECRRTAPVRPVAAGPQSLISASVHELANPLTPVLAAGAGVSAAFGSVLDSVLISGVMGVDALLGGAQRRSADVSLHRLTETTAVRVRLRRPAGPVAGDADSLVPGDVIELRAGDAVPADGRLIQAHALEIDESPLTGESQLVTKTDAPTAAPAVADRASMVYEGTTVAAGHGLAVVVATGEATEAGRTARLSQEKPPPSGVELRLRRLSRRILPAALGSGVVLMVVELLRGSPLARAVGPAVSMMVAAVPEGLPFVATVAELASAKRLSAHNTLVRNPSTIEALGRVDVLCFDKTGTLTEGHISLRRVSNGWTDQAVEDATPELRAIVGAALRAGPRFEGGRAIPHPTDRAIVEGAGRLGVTPRNGLRAWQRVDELPFEPGRGYHAVLGRSESGQLLSVKGAPEIVLTNSTSIVIDGRKVPLDDRIRKELEQEVDRLALHGYRVLAVAERPASSRADLDESRIESLCFLGFLGLADPIRPTAKRSVEGLMRAGVRVIMLTGDHPSTAEAIAAEIGALDGRRVMTGPELEELDDDALAEALAEVAVFARVTPEHKARIVTCLRKAGSVVAVTGDGANDVPAIRLADVGVALGSRAAPATRAAADIVVVDDRIETIIDAIVEGRAMWASVRDALGILLGGNVGEIAFTLGSSLLTGHSALNARQLLLVNLLTDMLPAMAVAVRPPSAASPERLLAEGPEASLGAALTRDIYLRAVTTAVAAGAAWLLARMTGTRGRADTVGLIGLVSAQLMQTLGLGGRDRIVVLAAVSSLAALGVIVSTPGLSQLFGCRPVGPLGWGIGLGCSAVAALLASMIERSAPDQSSTVHRLDT
ncbi:HAD-IC family P-type ATPase [Nonomuraea phyllanthi]|uniref:HAD-IC family P-type ATPase n=1 Tax=Nonomuraea phyllanthi TaxID=2219224 RepID=A0A5C4W3P4_9ACTN|nr:cation-translocating P-type ATPase [Nonomuraea phyllanthi]KAB8191554.1 HAD-IC family P-type ATPase [Nonomuraea phyllanthi]